MSYFKIGDMVNVPKHKFVGRVKDKQYRSTSEELKVRVEACSEITRSAYREVFSDSYWVSYDSLRSMNPIDIYRNKTTYPDPEGVPNLSFPKQLKERGIVKGKVVRIVDNYLLERMITYPASSRLFNSITLSELIKKGNPTLTGDKLRLDCGETAVACRFEDGDRYYIYLSCLQTVKVNIFKRFWNSRTIRTIRDNTALTLLSLYGVSMIIVTIAYFIFKHH